MPIQNGLIKTDIFQNVLTTWLRGQSARLLRWHWPWFLGLWCRYRSSIATAIVRILHTYKLIWTSIDTVVIIIYIFKSVYQYICIYIHAALKYIGCMVPKGREKNSRGWNNQSMNMVKYPKSMVIRPKYVTWSGCMFP